MQKFNKKINNLTYNNYAIAIWYYTLFLAKNQPNAKQHPEAGLLLFNENYSYSWSTLSSKTIGHTLKNKQKNKCVCINQITRLTTMKMKIKMENRSNRHNINWPRLRHGHKNSKYW